MILIFNDDELENTENLALLLSLLCFYCFAGLLVSELSTGLKQLVIISLKMPHNWNLF